MEQDSTDMKFRYTALTIVLATLIGSLVLLAQTPMGRTHSVLKKGDLQLVPATKSAPGESQVSITVEGDERIIRANGIPNHKTGSFPNSGNPNRISPQSYEYRMPAEPQPAQSVSPLRGVFGVAVNGIPFDPGAAEFFTGQQGTQWQYEPLSGAIALGIDVSHAHVQPNGAYHYHGLPTELLSSIKLEKDRHSPLVGWAADGFPIYAVYGYSDPNDASSSVQSLKSSFHLKAGERPGGTEPTGAHDGTFIGDYEFAEGAGELDQCNGRYCKTPEYPDGTYAYFLSEDWPVVPRNFHGTPSDSFSLRGPGPGGPPGFGPPPRGGPFGGPPPRGRRNDRN